MIKVIKRVLREMWMGIKIANENYLKGKTNQGKF
jgi:hypothetical protein